MDNIDAEPPADRRPNSSRRRVVTVIGGTGLLVALTPPGINVAFPAIRATFATATTGELSWVVTGYAIAFGGLMIPAGRLADQFNRRRALLVGLLALAIGAAAAALAPNLPVLVAGMTMQGAGAALVQPSSLALLLDAYPRRQRPHVISLWGVTQAAGVIAAPTIGAAIVTMAGWRAWFAAYLLMVLALHQVCRRLAEHSADGSPGTIGDRPGLVMLACAATLLAAALSQGRSWGWASPMTLAALAGALLIVGILVHRLRTHADPVIDPALAARPLVRAANIVTFFYAASLYAGLLMNILFLTTVWDYTILAAGLATVPAPAISAALAPFVGRAAGRYGHARLIGIGGLLFTGSYLYFIGAVHTSPAFVTVWLPPTLMMGVGFGIVFPTVTSAAAAGLEPHEFASGMALNQTIRQFGGVVGVAALAAAIADALTLTDFRRGWLWCAALAAVAAAAARLVDRAEA